MTTISNFSPIRPYQSAAAQMAAAVRAAEDAKLGATKSRYTTGPQDAVTLTAGGAAASTVKPAWMNPTPEMLAELQIYSAQRQEFISDQNLWMSEWLKKHSVISEKMQSISKRLSDAHASLAPFAVIRDERGKVVGQISQSGTIAVEEKYIWLLAGIVKNGESVVDGKHERFEAIRQNLLPGMTIELSGLDIDPEEAFPELYAERDAIMAEAKALSAERDAYIGASRAAMDAIPRPGWLPAIR